MCLLLSEKAFSFFKYKIRTVKVTVENMHFIGKDLKTRMNALFLNEEELAEKAYIDRAVIQGICADEIALEDVDAFDFELLCSVLHCTPAFFTDIAVKEKDFLVALRNKHDTKKTVYAKVSMQDFVNDFTFVNEVLAASR